MKVNSLLKIADLSIKTKKEGRKTSNQKSNYK